MVYRAEDVRLGREVAVKVVSQDFVHDQQALQRLRSEARAASALNHPNICTIFDIGEDEGRPFIVMELMRGATLRDRSTAAASRSAQLDRHRHRGGRRAARDAQRRHHPPRHQVRQYLRDRSRPREAARFRSRQTHRGVHRIARRAGDARSDGGWASRSAPSLTCRRNRPRANRSTVVPTSSRSASCSTSARPGRHPFSAGLVGRDACRHPQQLAGGADHAQSGPSDPAAGDHQQLPGEGPRAPLPVGGRPARRPEASPPRSRIGAVEAVDTVSGATNARTLPAPAAAPTTPVPLAVTTAIAPVDGTTAVGPLDATTLVQPVFSASSTPPLTGSVSSSTAPLPPPQASPQASRLPLVISIAALVAVLAFGYVAMRPRAPEGVAGAPSPAPGPAPGAPVDAAALQNRLGLANASFGARNYRAAAAYAAEVLAIDPRQPEAIKHPRRIGGDAGAFRCGGRRRASAAVVGRYSRRGPVARNRARPGSDRAEPDRTVVAPVRMRFGNARRPAIAPHPRAARRARPRRRPRAAAPACGRRPRRRPSPFRSRRRPTGRPANDCAGDTTAAAGRRARAANAAAGTRAANRGAEHARRHRTTAPGGADPTDAGAGRGGNPPVTASYARAIETKDIGLFRAIKPNLSREEERRLQDGFRAVTSQKVDDDHPLDRSQRRRGHRSCCAAATRFWPGPRADRRNPADPASHPRCRRLGDRRDPLISVASAPQLSIAESTTDPLIDGLSPTLTCVAADASLRQNLRDRIGIGLTRVHHEGRL